MSRAGLLGLLLLVVVVGGFIGLIVLANSASPPQRQVEGTVPDEKLPK